MGQFLGAARTLEAVPIVSSKLDPDLQRLLLGSLPDDRPSLEALGFEVCEDHPNRPGHRYLEGYFHAVPGAHSTCVDSIHPRYGAELARNPAPLPLAAFCEGVRRANAPLILALQKELLRSPNSAPLADVLQRCGHFADISVQIHWGEEVPREDIAWHIDAPNSLLHLAVGLRGRRALHARRRFNKQGAVSRNCLVGPTDESEVLWQDTGSAYMSVPCCYPHAVEYTQADWEDSIVALQCRLLLNHDELFRALDADPQGATASAVFRHLQAAAGLSLPSLKEVEGIMASMA
mmetsp:Transcript_59907/g.151746  ORF Transcript_59907/g.151746 Transcript_59907/m.151746 type:complete len:291 (+) Transcript_59907:85-957(+)